MKRKLSLKSLIFSLCLVVALLVVGGFSAGHQMKANASQNNVYDLSEWQGRLNDRKTNGLKKEVSFVILRAQHGATYDHQFQNNVNQMTKHQVPYGVYSYSEYRNNQQARNEAAALYNDAPRANFYVNDIEENDAGRRLNSATSAWAQEMKSLTTRPVVLYSGNLFISHNLKKRTLHNYDALWDAAYGPKPRASRHAVNYMPFKYDLWQYTSSHYSKALRQKVDASVLNGDKDLSFWVGKNGQHAVVTPVKVNKPKKNKKRAVKRNRPARRYGLWLNRTELRRYHHAMSRISKTYKHGRRLSRTERKALKIYKLRHGHNFKL